MSLVRKIVVFEKEIELPVAVDISSREQLESILREVDVESAERLRNVNYNFRIEGDKLIVFRTGAVFG